MALSNCIRGALVFNYAICHREFGLTTTSSDKGVAVLLHLSRFDHWQEFVDALNRIEAPFDIKVNLVRGLNEPDTLRRHTDRVNQTFPGAQVIESDNRGMDVGGMFRLFDLVRDSGYRALLYVHSKSDDVWRHAMLNTLTRNSSRAVDLLLGRDAGSNSRPVGMVGTYFHPFDYYNIGPCLELAAELGIGLETSWENYFRRYPASRDMPVGQRVAHAIAMGRPALRPEIDVEYAETFLGDIHGREQPMNAARFRRLKADGVTGPLPYFPGNCFWIHGGIIDKLARRISFDDEHARLPLNLASDRKFQSRAHAWERMLPVFALRNGFRLVGLVSGATDPAVTEK